MFKVYKDGKVAFRGSYDLCRSWFYNHSYAERKEHNMRIERDPFNSNEWN